MTVVSASVVASAIGLKGDLNHALPLIVGTFALTGIFQIGFGLIRVAQYVKYISYPVLSGFMAGIGIIIILFQWFAFFGHKAPKGIINIVSQLHYPVMNMNPSAFILAALTLILIYGIPRISKKIPASLVALIIATVVSLFMKLPENLLIGDIPTSIPTLKTQVFTEFQWSDLGFMSINALTLAGLGTIDTLLTSVVADNMTKTKHNGNRELMGQGLGNFITALFGGIPGAGATMGTVANIQAGARSNLGGIFKGLFLLIMMFGLGKFAKYIPIPVLSALLITVGIGVIDFKGIQRLIKLKNHDTLVLIIVILITVFYDLLIAVGVGMVLSSFFFMQKMGEIVARQSAQGKVEELHRKIKIPKFLKDKVFELELDGPLFYGFSDQFKHQAEAIKDKEAVIINMSHVPYIDASGIYVLEDVINTFKDKGMEVVVIGVKDHIFNEFLRLKFIPNVLPEEKVYNSVRAGIKYLNHQLAHLFDEPKS